MSRKILGMDPGVLLALALVVALVGTRLFLFQLFTIPSGSMEPTILPGDYVIASKFAYGRLLGAQPQRGDLVLFSRVRGGRTTTYVKRLIGLPGDQVQLKAGVVYINGKAAPQEAAGRGVEAGPFGLSHAVLRFRETLPNGRSYLVNSYGPDGEADNTDVYLVPAGEYFMLGDNRDNSADSRFPEALGGGYVPFDRFVARADLAISTHAKDADGQPNGLIRPLH